MIEIDIKEDAVLDMENVLFLYSDAGWSSYTKEPSALAEGISNSLKVITAWHQDLLVGLIRAVGDGATIVYIQDLLVLKDYQGQHIGSRLLQAILAEFRSVRQIVLITDQDPRLIAFYKKNKLAKVADMDCVAFIKLNQ